MSIGIAEFTHPKRGRMKYLLIALILSFPALALAQDETVDPVTECASVLAAPPFVDMLTRNEGKDFHELSDRENQQKLLGLACSVAELTGFFESAGWKFLGFKEKNLLGPFKRGDGTPDYYIDAAAEYCLKRPTLFGMFDFRCRPLASIYFHEARISSLNTSINK